MTITKDDAGNIIRQDDDKPMCPQWFANYIVASRSKDSSYFVQLNGPTGPKFCSCPAFRFSGEYGKQNCKHIDLVLEHGCLWRGPDGTVRHSGDNNLEEVLITKVSDKNSTKHGPLLGAPCPNCQEPTTV